MRAQALQVVEIGAGAGDAPVRFGELLAQLPVGRRPDVLGVGGERPAHAADHRRVAGHGGRRVQEVGVEPVDIGRELAGKHAGLAEAPAPVDGRISLEIPVNARRAWV